MARIKQEPIIEGNWLYHDEYDGNRLFSDYILIEEEKEPWKECSYEAMVEWKESHPEFYPPEPPEKEPELNE